MFGVQIVLMLSGLLPKCGASLSDYVLFPAACDTCVDKHGQSVEEN